MELTVASNSIHKDLTVYLGSAYSPKGCLITIVKTAIYVCGIL